MKAETVNQFINRIGRIQGQKIVHWSTTLSSGKFVMIDRIITTTSIQTLKCLFQYADLVVIHVRQLTDRVDYALGLQINVLYGFVVNDGGIVPVSRNDLKFCSEHDSITGNYRGYESAVEYA